MNKVRYIFLSIFSISLFGYFAFKNFGYTKETAAFVIVIAWYIFYAIAPPHIKLKLRGKKVKWPSRNRMLKITIFTILGFVIFLLLITSEMWL